MSTVHGKIGGQHVSGEGSLFDVPPAAIGRFRVLHQIGAGTSGPVFRAVHPETDAPLAIKLFTLAVAPERVTAVAADLETLVERFPPADGTCELIDAGVHGNSAFLVTAFAPGDSLDVALKQFGPASLIDLVPRLRTMARALDGAAARGVLHGALHARDVLVSDATTLLTGIGAWPILVRHGERLPIRRPFRAPELADSAVTAAGDRFALAALAYEWTTGRRAPSAFVARDLAPLPGVDGEALGRVFAIALHADPGERFDSSEAFVDELDQIEVEDPDAAFVPEPPKSEPRPRRRRALPDTTSASRLPLDAIVPGAPVPAAPPIPMPELERAVTDEPASEPALAHFAMEERVEPEPAPVRPPEPAPVRPPEPAPSVGFPSISQRDPVPSPSPPAGGRLFQAANYETLPPPSPPTPRGGRRLAAGLLLGAVLGVGAGYLAWGPHGAPQNAAVEESAGAPDTPASQPSASEPDSKEVAASPPPAAPGGASAPAAGAAAASEPSSRVPAAGSMAGNLLVRSAPPGATVFVDDQRRGVTPLTLQNVELGTRRVRVVRDGFAAEDRQITLTRSRPSRSIDVRLTRAAPVTRPAPTAPAAASGTPAARTGSLVIESRPTGATVVLNGRAVGSTPMTLDDLEPGTYTVQLRLAAFRPITTTVRVVAGARARAAASLVSTQEPE
jgi:hypothetical protein